MNRKTWIGVSVVVAVAVAIAAAFQFLRSDSSLQKRLAPPVKLVLGTPGSPSSENVFIAKQLGFFRDEGLDVTLLPHPSGALALAALLAGKTDLAVVTETPIVFAALRGARFFILATIHESGTNVAMIGRRDRGIAKPSDLAGKRLGTVFGTNAEFFQDTILAIHNIDPRSIVRVNLAPAHAEAALLAGEVDALTIWAPHWLELRKRLGDAAEVFGDETIYTTTYNLVARDELVKQHPEAIRRILAALIRATAIARSDPARAIPAVVEASGYTESAVKAIRDPRNFTVALNQSLVISMEDQAQWAIRRELVETAVVPNFLNWIHADALAAVNPEAVSVIR